MNPRAWISGTLILVGLAAAAGVFRQHHELTRLRSELGNLRAVAPPRSAGQTNPVPQPPAAARPLTESEKHELLRLRAEVTRLDARRRELASARTENERLQTAHRARNPGTSPAGTALPAGYIRRTEARFQGAATPEAALESLLWAMTQRDTNALARLMPPEWWDHARVELARNPEEFWKQSRLPGFRVVEVLQPDVDHAVVKLEILPGKPPEQMKLTRVGGEWRLEP